MYSPMIKSSTCIRRYVLAPFLFALHSEIQNFESLPGMPGKPIQYLYILAACREGETQPCLFVASEEEKPIFLPQSSPSDMPKGYFLGAFTNQGHLNYGKSKDWADLELFTTRALQIATQQLGVSGVPQLVYTLPTP